MTDSTASDKKGNNIEVLPVSQAYRIAPVFEAEVARFNEAELDIKEMKAFWEMMDFNGIVIE